MNKKIVFGYWFYTIAIIIFVLIGVGGTSLTIALGIIYPESYIEKQLDGWITLVIMFSLATVYLIVAAGSLLIQFTVISDKGIKTRAPFRTIRYLEWSEVKEVRFEKFYVSVQGGFTSGWYVFDDGVERNQRNGLVRKNSHITIPATKRTRKIIEMFWRGPIIEEQKQ